MEKRQRYPVGEQSFKVIREEGFLYVDKTKYLEKIVKGSQYYFLGRPRRFGKSLFLSTLKFFFEGRRDLFKGLYADTMEWEWESYPVLHLSLNMWDYKKRGQLDEAFNTHLSDWEKEYGIDEVSDDISSRFRAVIRRAYEKTGKKVVILVDEYDNPLVDTLDMPERFEDCRNQLSAIYSNFKSSADYIRLVFLTGVSRFGKISVFSGLNNIQDISFDREYSAICGITEKELLENFRPGIERLAYFEQQSEEETMATLKKYYDGYHFSRVIEDIYNPFSILNAMDKGEFGNYWVQSGQTSLISRQLPSYNLDLESLFNKTCPEESLLGIEPDSPTPVALLYQTGYLTIKHYDRELGLFTLGLPNDEVRRGFINNLLPYYSSIGEDETAFTVGEFLKELRQGDAEGFMRRLQSLFAGYSYEMRLENENNFHNVIYMLMILLGMSVETERKTSDGRIDLLITTSKYRYVIELKVDSSPEAALRQINDKEYHLQFSPDWRKIIKIGVNFSTESRRITGWIIE